jgi:hypothetical protein
MSGATLMKLVRAPVKMQMLCFIIAGVLRIYAAKLRKRSEKEK